MPVCPSESELAAFLSDTLAPERMDGVAAHLETCAECRKRLIQLAPDHAAAATQRTRVFTTISPGAEPPTEDGARSLSEAITLPLGSNTPLSIRHQRPIELPQVPGFEIVREIGRGGMGVVYEARHRRMNRRVALKMILAGSVADPRTVQRFLFEAEILARVQHPQVVQVFEVDTFTGPDGVAVPYQAIELLEGGSLAERLRDGPLEPHAAAELVEGIARAVHAVHLQGVIHRDLKPGNILFPAESPPGEHATPAGGDSAVVRGGSAKPKVTDFGLAKFIQDGAELTGTGQVVGTPQYMAPEQAAGSRQVGPVTDVYSLGAILFECLTGRSPFQGAEPMSVLVRVVTEVAPDVRTLRRDLPRDLSAVVAHCLEKDPQRRYASAEDLADDLRRYLDNRPTKARPSTPRERLWLWAQRNPAVAGLLSALALVLVVGFAAVTWFWIEAHDTALSERQARKVAERAEGEAKEAQAAATSALKLARHSEGEALNERNKATIAMAQLEFDRAMEWCEEGRISEGLESFLRVVELAEMTGARDLARVARSNIAAWPRELPRARKAIPHEQQPRLAAFLPNGGPMVTAGRGSAVSLWDTATRRRIRKYHPLIQKPLYRISGVTYWTVAVSPDGRTIAAGSSDGFITIWDTESSRARMSFDAVAGADENVWTVAFALDGTLWASDGAAGLKRWKVTGTAPVLLAHAVPREPGAILQVLAISADGSRVYSGDRAGMIREWDAATATELRNWFAGGWVQDLALSPNGSRVAATGPGGIARIIDVTTGRVALDINLAGAYGNGVAFAPTVPYLLTSDGDGNVRTWHCETGMQIGLPMRFSGEVTRIRFRPWSAEFAVPAGNAMFVCSIPDPPYDVVTAGSGRRIRGLDLSPDGELVAVSDDAGFELLDLFKRRGRLQRVDYDSSWPYFQTQEPPLTIRFDPDPGRRRVFRGTRTGVDQLAVPEGALARPVRKIALGRVSRMAFLRGGSHLLAVDDRVVARLDARTLGDPRFAVVENLPPGFEVRALAARPDGREVLLAFARRVIFLDSETLRPEVLRTGWLPRPKEWSAGDEVLDATYTPDGARVLIARRDNRAELRDATTGALLIPPLQHGKAVLAVAVSPDGRVLLTASRDGTARFWDAATGLPLGAPLRHLGPVTHAVYAANGEHAVTGTGTGHVLLWDSPPSPVEGSLQQLRAAIEKYQQ